MNDDIRFPIGTFEPTPVLTLEARSEWIQQVPQLANKLRKLTNHLCPEQLRMPYRPDGWSIQQIVHHLADNDMNAYLRFKRALTEIEPTASSYREDLWGELPDYQDLPVEHSIALLELLHYRFYTLLRTLPHEEFQRKLTTEVLGSIPLDTALQRFVWHGTHHLSQIEMFCHRQGW